MKRIIGLDIYRLLAMVLITNIHYFGYSKVITNPDLLPFNKYFILINTSFTSCFVDMFVLLTGYLLGRKICKKMRLVDLWFQTFIVGVIMLIACGICSPSSLSLKTIAHTIFPITTFTYWYLIPYGMLFILIPFINKLMDGTERRKLQQFIMVWGGVFLIIEVNPIMSLDWFIGNYMSIVWFAYIYVIGAYIARYGFPFNNIIWSVLGIASATLMIAIKVIGIHCPMEMRLTSFCSPLPLIVSLSLFLLLSKVNSLGKRTDALLSSLSASSLCIYLVQEQTSFRQLFWPAIIINDFAGLPYLILHWVVTVSTIFFISWIAYKLYLLLYGKFLSPRVVTLIVEKMKKHINK